MGSADGERLRIVIADDEPISRDGLRELLETDPAVEVVGAFSSGNAALEGIRELKPHLALLDIQMPGLSGIEVVEALMDAGSPAIIFVTAYAEFAVEAFEANAIDYLLKPFTDARLYAAIDKARDRVRDRDSRNQLDGLRRYFADRGEGTGRPEPREPSDQPIERLIVRDLGKRRIVPVTDIDWIEAEDYYARVHCGGRSLLVRESLSSLEARLDGARFFRIHKSAIVNLTRVTELRNEGKTDCVVFLRDGTKLPLGRGRRPAFESLLERVR